MHRLFIAFRLRATNRLTLLLSGVALVAVSTSAGAQPFNVPDRDPKVNMRFDRYYDYPATTEALRTLQAAYPKFLTIESIGKSSQGRDLWVMIINNPDTGLHTSKRAFWADANIHGNEIQGTVVNLYLIWFLMENYASLPKVRELVDRLAFYIMPFHNPDGSQNWFDTGGPSRGGMRPWDSDGDGRLNEDPPVDLTGNREILQMRKYVPGEGTHVISPVDPRLMVLAPWGTRGDYIMVGSEAIDHDGDGRRGEDPPGGYDLNRNWGADWQPEHIARGAHWYPFSHPETRASADFLMAHPNVAGVQSWHNSGGMILRSPGSQYYMGRGELLQRDERTYDFLGRQGELILPYYRYLTTWKGLYTIYGGLIDWTYDQLGIFSFLNELWSTQQLYNEAWVDDGRVPAEMRQLFFNDRLGMGSWFVAWEEVDHPELGKVEIGGWSKWFGRTTPPFLLQELAHRNAMFALFHADQMPLLVLDEPSVERIGGNTYRVTAQVRNERAIPSRTQSAEINRIGEPDYFRIEGPRARVTAGGYLRRGNPPVLNLVERGPEQIEVKAGVPGMAEVSVSWIVQGSGPVTITYQSVKGGTVTRTIDLR